MKYPDTWVIQLFRCNLIRVEIHEINHFQSFFSQKFELNWKKKKEREERG